VYVHTLEFVDTARLAAAFERIASDEQVEDCLVETAQMRIRFVAPPERASWLIERIYQDGGLRFSQRHRVARGLPAGMACR
jgi:hypothetical protein